MPQNIIRLSKTAHGALSDCGQDEDLLEAVHESDSVLSALRILRQKGVGAVHARLAAFDLHLDLFREWRHNLRPGPGQHCLFNGVV